MEDGPGDWYSNALEPSLHRVPGVEGKLWVPCPSHAPQGGLVSGLTTLHLRTTAGL